MMTQPVRLHFRVYFYFKESFTVVSSAHRGIGTADEETIYPRPPVTLCSNGYAGKGGTQLSLSPEPRGEFFELAARSISSPCLRSTNITASRNVNPGIYDLMILLEYAQILPGPSLKLV